MADPERVTELKPLPTSVSVSQAGDFRMTPNEMRELKAATGKTLTDLMGDEGEDADRVQALIWLQLRRDGYEPSWEQAGDVSVIYEGEVADPTSAAPSKSWPLSADSGE